MARKAQAFQQGLGSIYLLRVRNIRPCNIQNEVLLPPEWA